MGGTDSKIDETEIRNEIQVDIDVATKNLNKVFNETVTEVTTKMVNQTENEIKITTLAQQDMEVKDITANGPCTSVDMTQESKVNTENQAIMQIMNNNQALNDMQSKIQNDLVNKTSNDAAAKASMETLNKLEQTKKDAGGPEAMVAAAMKAVSELGKSVTGGSSKEEKKTKIVNQMKQNLKMSTTNSNDITNIVKQATKSFAENIQKSACKMDTNALQKMKVGNITATDCAKVKLAQKIDLTAFNKCAIGSTNLNSVINTVTSGTGTAVTNDTSNKASADSKLKADNTIKQVDEKTSSIMDTFKALGMTAMIIPALIGIVVIGGIIYAVSRVMNFADANPDMVKDAAKQAQGLPTNDEMDNENEENNKNNNNNNRINNNNNNKNNKNNNNRINNNNNNKNNKNNKNKKNKKNNDEDEDEDVQTGGAIKKTYDTIFYALIIILVLNALIRK